MDVPIMRSGFCSLHFSRIGLFGDADTFVAAETCGVFAEHYRQVISFHGEHRLIDKSLIHSVIPVVRWIDDRQEGRERPKTVFMHTSGSVGMDVFDGLSDNCGVLYPMQTFSKDKTLDFKKIPCFIEGNNEASRETIMKLASTISDNVHYMTSDDRKWLHLAAVFACNFSNACYVVADGILRRNGLDFTVLRPLIEETVSKLGTLAPIDAQTGPAVRGDQNIMDSQAAMLADNESLQKLYIKMSEIIAQQQSNKNVESGK